MALNKVEICGVNTSKLPVLTAEEKAELFRRIKNGDEQARELYIKGNLRLVLSVIRRFQNSSENADDLFQIGCIGLIKAIDNFDTTLQVKFSTYAVPMIIGEIRRYLRDNNSIRVSRSLRDIAYKAIYTRENYMKQHLKEPTVTEIAQEIGIEYKSVRFRTLGCYPLTGGVESKASTLDEIIDETLSAVSSERTTRVIDNEAAGSMERRKREGYF